MHIDSNVFKAIYKTSIRKFLEARNIRIDKLAEQFYLDSECYKRKTF